MNPNCECEKSGFCERHKMYKGEHLYNLCKGIADTSDCGHKYWRAWEQGKLGATAPENPTMQGWECKEEEVVIPPEPVIKPSERVRRRTKRRSNFKSGNRLANLGDLTSVALSKVGITEERVSKWLGRKCNCGRRREKLNRLGAWVSRVIAGETEDAEKYLEEMLNE